MVDLDLSGMLYVRHRQYIFSFVDARDYVVWQELASVAHSELLYVLVLLGFLFTLMNFVWLKTTQLVQIFRISFNSGALYVNVYFFWPLSEHSAGGTRSDVTAGNRVAGYQDYPASLGNRVPTAW